MLTYNCNWKDWPWKALIPGAFVFVAALLIRIIYLCQASSSPTFYSPIIDSATYDYIARRIVYDGVMDDRFFWHSFFYPFFLSRIYYFTGGSILAAKIVQAILGSVTSVLVYVLGRKLFSHKIGIVSGLIYALYGPAVFFESQLLATGWACFWSITLILLLLKTERSDKRWPHLVTGLCAGTAILTRATFVPFVVATGIWLIIHWYRAKLGPKLIVTNAILLLLGIATTFSPVLILSHIETKRITLLPEAGPLNLYIGNNPHSSQTRTIRPGHKWTQFANLSKYGAQNSIQAGEHFVQQVKDYAMTQPGDFMKNMAGKAGEFFTSREIPRNIDIYRETKDSSLLSAMVFKIGSFGFPFGVLFPLSLIGLWLQRRRVTWPVILFLILYPLAIILVFPAARYRIPIIPLLAPLAAAGFLGIIDFIKKDAKPLKAVCSIIFAVVAATMISIAGPYPLENYDFEAEMHYCVGYNMWENQNFDQAQMHLSKATSLMPDYADAHNILGRTLYVKGQYQQARQHLETATELNPLSYSGHYYLGKVMLQFGENSAALEEFEKAAELAAQAGNTSFAATAKQAAANCQK